MYFKGTATFPYASLRVFIVPLFIDTNNFFNKYYNYFFSIQLSNTLHLENNSLVDTLRPL